MAGTIAVREDERFDTGAVERYLRSHVENLPEGNLEVRQFSSGASNLTYLLKIGDWEAVLRRPPLGPIPPKAHDMSRESLILSRIHPHFPLAPKLYSFCDDESVIGASFYVMERRRGLVIDQSFPDKIEPTPELCRGLSEMLCDTLVQLHSVDWKDAGLEDLGKHEGFLERQVKGWISRYEKAKTDEVEEVRPLTEWLAEYVPQSPPATIIHNDYKLNNFILNLDDPTEPVALVDWEMTTIGDPLFDLAVSLSYYVNPQDPEDLKQAIPTVTDSPGFMVRRGFMNRYAERSGRDLSDMHWYMVFGYFKLAVIIQQIYARWKNGQTKDERFAIFGQRMRTVIVHAYKLSRSDGV